MEKLKLQYFGDCSITCLITGGRRKIHCTYKDNSERIEEYDKTSHELLVRKTKKASTIKETAWTFEFGEPPKSGEALLNTTNKNPIFARKDTQKEYSFRIRNLPYPKETYELSVENNQIVVKTTNKKYFKRIDIPDHKLSLEQSKINWTYQNGTLIISYPKPDAIVILETQLRKEFDKLNAKKPQEGDVECVQQ